MSAWCLVALFRLLEVEARGISPMTPTASNFNRGERTHLQSAAHPRTGADRRDRSEKERAAQLRPLLRSPYR